MGALIYAGVDRARGVDNGRMDNFEFNFFNLNTLVNAHQLLMHTSLSLFLKGGIINWLIRCVYLTQKTHVKWDF